MSTLGRTKTHDRAERGKRSLALSILHSLSLLLSKPAVVCTENTVSLSGRHVQAAPTVCKLEVERNNQRRQVEEVVEVSVFLLGRMCIEY